MILQTKLGLTLSGAAVAVVLTLQASPPDRTALYVQLAMGLPLMFGAVMIYVGQRADARERREIRQEQREASEHLANEVGKGNEVAKGILHEVNSGTAALRAEIKSLKEINAAKDATIAAQVAPAMTPITDDSGTPDKP